MEGNAERLAAGDRPRPTLERDPDHPNYIGPILISLDEIVLFGRDDCEVCERVRTLLRKSGLPWREVEASAATGPRQLEQLVYTGYLHVPTLCAAGYAVVGFDEARIVEVLEAHAARLARKAGASRAETASPAAKPP
jgi:glutaredoxin